MEQITNGEAELLTYLKQLQADGKYIQLSLHPTNNYKGESTIRRTPTNICKVEANTDPRYRSFEEVSEGEDIDLHFNTYHSINERGGTTDLCNVIADYYHQTITILKQHAK